MGMGSRAGDLIRIVETDNEFEGINWMLLKGDCFVGWIVKIEVVGGDWMSSGNPCEVAEGKVVKSFG